MVFLNKFKVFLGIFIPFLIFFLMSQNTVALSLTPTNVNFNYNTSANGSFDWSPAKTIPGQGRPVGSESYISPVKNLRYMQLNYQPTSLDGNHAALHFEANVVFIKNSLQATMIWQHLSSQQITSCLSNSTPLNIENQALSFAQTSWDNGNRNTLTIYGDITLSGLPSGSTGQSIHCNFGNTSTPFFSSDLPSATSIYLEQVPTSIVFSNNLNDALLAQQIAQYEVQIQLQNQMNDKLDDLSSQSQQNTQDIIKSNQRCRSSRNLLQSINWQTNNVTKTEDGDIVKFTANSGTLARAVFGLPFLEQGKTYTLSFYSKGVSTAGSLTYARIREYSNSGNWITPQSTIPVSSDFVRVSVTFTVNDVSSPFAWLYLSASASSSNNIEIYVKDFQLEEGSSATEYIPFGEEICKNINEDYYDEQRQADQNISNQNSSSIQGSENQQTTNLIGVLSNFLTQLQSFSATDCNLSLPFPSFIGGTQVVNICQGKDVLGNFITIIGTLAMVGFYIPLAVVLLKMIYNEIRSFTNG